MIVSSLPVFDTCFTLPLQLLIYTVIILVAVCLYGCVASAHTLTINLPHCHCHNTGSSGASLSLKLYFTTKFKCNSRVNAELVLMSVFDHTLKFSPEIRLVEINCSLAHN